MDNAVTVRKRTRYAWDQNTLHSPYEQGIINTISGGYIDTYSSSANSAVQICYSCANTNVCIRKMSAATWGDWIRFTTNADMTVKSTPITMINGWTCPYTANTLKLYQCGNIYMLHGIVRAPANYDSSKSDFAEIGTDFNYLNYIMQSAKDSSSIYGNTHNGRLWDQYTQAIAGKEYLIRAVTMLNITG